MRTHTQTDERPMNIHRSAWWVATALATGIAVVFFAVVAEKPLVDGSASSPAAMTTLPGVPDVRVAAIQQSISGNDLLAVVHEQNLGPRSVISLVDQDSGRLLGQIEAGDSPLVLVRRSRNQLLISDTGLLGPGTDQAIRLLTFELSNSLSVVHQPLEMARRTKYPIYAPSMLLSEDERFLYYMKRWDCGFLCNEVAVGVVDLDLRVESIAPLPINCGHVLLTRLGPSDAAGMCPITGMLWAIQSSGASVLLADFEPNGVYGGVSVDGNRFWITSGAELIVKSAQGDVLIRKSLEAPGALSGIYRWRSDHLVFLGVKAGPEHMGHIIRLDTSTWSVSVMRLPARTTYAAVLPEGRLALAHDGVIEIVNATTGLPIRPPYTAPPGLSPWIVGP